MQPILHIFGFIIGMVPAIVSFILRLIAADPNGELSHFLTIAQAIEWVMRFFPPFCFAKGKDRLGLVHSCV